MHNIILVNNCKGEGTIKHLFIIESLIVLILEWWRTSQSAAKELQSQRPKRRS